MKAKDLMTKSILKISNKASIAEAVEMCVNNRVSGLVVVDDKGVVYGILSEKDLMIAFDFLGETDSGIEEFITKEVVCVSEETPLDEISRLLVQRNFKRVPVKKGGEIVGIISRGDILKWIFSEKMGRELG